MNIFKKLFVVVAVVGSVLSASAETYKASQMQMTIGSYTTSSVATTDMVLLGENADGQQIWACNKPEGKVDKYARWADVSAGSMSLGVDKFEKNKKYSITNDYNEYADRAVESNTTDLYVVKNKAKNSADLFIWDGTSTPDCAKEFYIVPRVTMTVDNVYIDSYYNYNQKLTYAITGVTLDAIDHINLDCLTQSWTTIATLTELSGTYTKGWGNDVSTRRYRIVVYLKDKYKVLAKDGVCTAKETGLITGQHVIAQYSSYKGVGKATMNVGSSDVYDVEMKELGATSEGYQIWACNNPGDSYTYAYWWFELDEDTKYSATFTSLGYNEELSISTDYVETHMRTIPRDASKWFFLRKFLPYAEGATVFCWDMSNIPSFAYKYHVAAHFNMQLSDPVYLSDDKSYLQQMEWTLSGATSELFDHAEIQKSLDGGKTWVTLYDNASFYGNAIVEVPITEKNVRFRAIAYPKDRYKVVANNGCWSSVSDVKELKPSGLSCSVTATEINTTDDYVCDPTTGAKTYKTTVAWECSDNMTTLFGGGTMQYSTDKGKTWQALFDIDAAKGSEEVNVPVGYTDYQFRATVKPSGNVSDEDRYSITAVSNTVSVTYNEADVQVESFVAGTPAVVSGYTDLSKVALTYKISKTLLQLCDNAYITYSFDGYKTNGHPLQSFDPEESGDFEVIVPNNIKSEDSQDVKGACTFRLEIYYTINGERKCIQYPSAAVNFPTDK